MSGVQGAGALHACMACATHALEDEVAGFVSICYPLLRLCLTLHALVRLHAAGLRYQSLASRPVN
eukprot:352239-Chlamydomonas_euryale.AAC.9